MTRVAALTADYPRWNLVLALIREAFASMDGVIDPPSSAHLLTESSLREKAERETALAVLEDGVPVACLFCERRGDALYLGKLAVAASHRGRGLGAALIDAAENLAREAGLAALELQTRVELTGNLAYFAARGFAKSGEGSHAGYDRPTWIALRKPVTG